MVDATPACWSNPSCSSNASAGVSQPRTLRGLVWSARATAANSSADHRDRSVPFGKYWRSSPLEFSFVARCQGDWGSAKNTGMPVLTLNAACADISFPRSHVSDRASSAGGSDIVFAKAVFVAVAP